MKDVIEKLLSHESAAEILFLLSVVFILALAIIGDMIIAVAKALAGC